MTARLLLANGLELAVGAGVARALRAPPGCAYLLGLATVGVLSAHLALVHVAFGWTALAVAAAVSLPLALRLRPRLRPRPLDAVALALLAALLARAWVAFSTKPLDDYDAWAIWGMKARALTLLGWADPSLFASRVALPAHPDYPLLVPSLEAVAARAMGGFDPRLVHLQFLLLGVAGIAAIHALARERAPRLVVWPLLLALAAAPAFASQLLTAYADVPLALLVAAGTLAAARCLDRPGPRPAATAALLLGAAALTKEEGLLFAAAALLALLLARAPWRRVLALAAGTELLLAPWQAWLFLESPPRDPAQALALQPPGIGTVVVRKLLEDALSVPSWTLLLPLFGAAVLAAAGSRLAAFAWGWALLSLLGLAGIYVAAHGAWLAFSYSGYRVVDSLVVGAAALTPLLLAEALRPQAATTRASSSIEVSPAATFASPSSQSVRIPERRAARSISSRLAFATASDSISSLICRSWKMPIRPR